MSWDTRWMDMARLVATWSKDRSRQCGAVIVDSHQRLISIGWNGFPRGINDDVDERHERPIKYKWTEHAERNALYNCAAAGHPTCNCTMFIPWYPCADCARAIIQSGIIEIVCIEPDWNDHIWAADFAVVKEMMDESTVKVRFITKGEQNV
jgi:dCMP deaminase